MPEADLSDQSSSTTFRLRILLPDSERLADRCMLPNYMLYRVVSIFLIV